MKVEYHVCDVDNTLKATHIGVIVRIGEYSGTLDLSDKHYDDLIAMYQPLLKLAEDNSEPTPEQTQKVLDTNTEVQSIVAAAMTEPATARPLNGSLRPVPKPPRVRPQGAMVGSKLLANDPPSTHIHKNNTKVLRPGIMLFAKTLDEKVPKDTLEELYDAAFKSGEWTVDMNLFKPRDI